MTEPAENRLGTEFEGRYEILRLLGEGGMGAVYEARHKFTQKLVALKIFHLWVTRTPGARERFLREAQAPNAIGHPAIAEVIDAGIAADGTPYLVLELLRGDSLNQAIAKGPLSVAELIRISIEVLGALGAAHERGLVHRDVKPENVFLCDGEPRRVKVLDFGILRQVDGNSKITSTGQILGTPHYMSPEQARGGEVDARSDLWSVGAMLFDALAGKPPYEAANYNLIIVAILTEDPPRLRDARPDVPAEIEAIVERALKKKVEERWQSAREMMQALASAGGVSFSGATAAFVSPVASIATGARATPMHSGAGITPPVGSPAPTTALPTPAPAPNSPAPTPFVGGAAPRSGAGSAKPSDGEWGPGESHSLGRGGAGPSERGVPATSFGGAPPTSPFGGATGVPPSPSQVAGSFGAPVGPAVSNPGYVATTALPAMSNPSVAHAPPYAVPRPASKKSGAGCYIATAIVVLFLFLGAGGAAVAIVAMRSGPGTVEHESIAEPEIPDPPELPSDPTEELAEPDAPPDLGEGIDFQDPDLQDPTLREEALERMIQRAFEQQERREEEREPDMRLTKQERVERRRAAMCVTRCMTRAQRVCRRPNMEAECQATYLACITGCGNEADAE